MARLIVRLSFTYLWLHKQTNNSCRATLYPRMLILVDSISIVEQWSAKLLVLNSAKPRFHT